MLVTTRNPAVALGQAHLAVNVLTRSESIEFLEHEDPHVTPDEAEQLATLLGDLPLALAQVASMHAATGMPWSRYIDLFDGHMRQLLQQGRPSDHQTGLTASVDLTLQRLKRESPSAAQLLEALTHLSSEPVAPTLLRSGRSGRLTPALARCLDDPDHLQRATAELIRYGLVTEDGEGELLSMHRLVRECLRQGFDAATNQRGLNNARAIVIAADPGDPDDTRTWGMHALISPHIAPTTLVNLPSLEAKHLVVNQIRYLYQIGDYQGSRVMAESALREWTAGPEEEAAEAFDEYVVMATRHLANALRSLGDYEPSREMTSITLGRLRRHEEHGPDHPLTLEVAVSAGVDLRIQGRYAEALSMEEDTLKRSELVFGENDPQTLRVATNLAVSLRMLGDFQAAHDLDQRVLESRSAIPTIDPILIHMSTLNLAWDLYGLGKYEDMFSRVETARTTLDPWLLRPGHVLPLLVARSTAVALRCLGRPEALTAAEESYQRHMRYLGGDRERSLAASLTYVNALCSTSQYQSAWSRAQEAQESYLRSFGGDHPAASAASVVLARALRGLGRIREAHNLDEKAMHDLMHPLGLAHPFSLSAANGLAADLLLEGRSRSARDLSRRTLDAASERVGSEHPVSIACNLNHATASRLALEGNDGQAHQPEWVELNVEPPPV